MRPQENPIRILESAVMALLFFCSFFAPGSALAAGGCTSAPIPETFLLPDGTEHAPARLTVCIDRRYSPVSALHLVRVNGMSVGMHLSRHSTSEGPGSGDAFMMFNRGTDGRLYLVGYANPGRDGMEIYTLRPSARRKTVDSRRMAQELGGSGERSILIAARTH